MSFSAKRPRLALFASVVETTHNGDTTARLQDCPDSSRHRKHVFPGEIGNAALDDEGFRATFSLPTALNKFETLKTINKFPRDSRVEFFEAEHYYEIDGLRSPRSVTSVVHQFEIAFDADTVTRKMRAGAGWQQVKRMELLNAYGEEMSDTEIKEKYTRARTILVQ